MCGNEIKISQYANDTTMILDDSKKSFTSVLLDLELFCAISGLRLKAGVNVKAVFTSLNTAFLPISRSRFKRRQIPMLITLSTIWQFCVNFWVIFRCFGKERFFLKG